MNIEAKDLVTIGSAVLGLASGAVGYLATNFWMKPILKFHELRERVASDLVYFSNVQLDQPPSNTDPKWFEQNSAFRKSSSDLTACLINLPDWYKAYLDRRGYDIEIAKSSLIGLSNTNKYEHASACRKKIMSGLKLDMEEL